MSRAAFRAAGRWGLVSVCLLPVAFCLVLGCAHRQQIARPQAEDDGEPDPYKVQTVGDVVLVDNVNPIPVSGVGLVVGLGDNGGGAPAGSYRTMLEDQLKKKGVTNLKELLASHDV